MKHKALQTCLIIGLFLLTGCQEEKLQERLDDDQPKITIDTFSLTETNKGKKVYTLDAVRARVYDEIIKVDSVEIRFYDREEVEFSVLYAQPGILNTKTRNILVGDSVVLLYNDST